MIPQGPLAANWTCNLAALTCTYANSSLNPTNQGGSTPQILLTYSINSGASSPANGVQLNYFGNPQAVNPPSIQIAAPALTAVCTPSPLSFSYTIGGMAPANETCAVSFSPAGLNVSASVTQGNSWLSASLGSGVSPLTLTVSVSLNGLTAQTYQGMIQLSATGAAPVNLPVTFTVSPQAMIAATCTPSPLSFSFTIGGTAPANQTCAVTFSAGLTVSASVTQGNSWLSASLSSGASPETLTVSVNPSGLTAQTYQGTIQLSATGAAPVNLQVTLTVNQQAAITANCTPSPLSFSYTINGTAPANETCAVTFSAGLSVSAVVTQGSWLSASLSPSASPETLTVSVNPNGLTAQTYQGMIQLSAAGAVSVNLPVTLTVSQPAVITANCTPSPLAFSYTIAGAAPSNEICAVAFSSGLSVSAAVTQGNSWLSASLGSGSSPVILTVSVNPSGLAGGPYQGAIQLSATGAPSVNLPVTLTVSQPVISTNCGSSLTFSFTVGGSVPVNETCTVTFSPAGLSVSAAVTQGNAWLTASLPPGPSPETLTVSVNIAGLAAGPYTGSIVLSATGALSLTLPVALTVSSQSVVSTNCGSLSFSFAMGGITPPNQTCAVTYSPAGLSVSAAVTQGSAWLSASLTSGASPLTLTALANPTGLALGQYQGTILLSAANVPSVTVPVTLNVSQPVITANCTPSPLSFSYFIGGTAPASEACTVTVSPTGPSVFAAVNLGGAWLSASLAYGVSSATLTVSVNPTGLAVGPYQGSILLSASGAPAVTLPVTLTVGNPTPVITANCTPSPLSFSYTAGGAAPASGTCTIAVSPSGLTVFAAVTQGGAWLSASLVSAVSSAILTVSVNPSALAAGSYSGTVSLSAAGASAVNLPVTLNVSSPTGLDFYPVTPCRVADTRTATGMFGGPIVAGGSIRNFPIPASACGIPTTAQAYSLNVTVVPQAALNYLTIWPTGQPQPNVSTLNAPTGATSANAAIVPAGGGPSGPGSVSVFVTDTTHVILDINGYFAPPGSGGATQGLAFYPLAPCRVADTRNSAGAFGGPQMTAASTRSFPMPSSGCAIPSTALAYSLNMTVVPARTLTYLTAWPTGQAQPNVSTLNASDGRIVANAAIVPAGTNGAISVFVSDATDVIVDIDGYIAPPGNPGALYFYTATPCRVADTRNPNGPFGGPILNAGNARSFPVPESTCGIPSTAQGYSLNVTAVPPGPLTYLTIWPTSGAQPLVSTLNALSGAIVANAAIVPAGGAGIGGAISVYVSNTSQVILDINGYFAPPGS